MDRSQDTSLTDAPGTDVPATAPPSQAAPDAPSRATGAVVPPDVVPPWPLPPEAFLTVPEPMPPRSAPPAPMPPRVFLRSGPAFEAHGPDVAGPPPAAPSTGPQSAAGQPWAIDDILSEIEAEAAERSLTAVSGAAAAPIVPSASDAAAALTASGPASAAAPDLGSLVPAAPRFEMPSARREPTFGGLQADPFVRSDLSAPEARVPAVETGGYDTVVRRIVRIAGWLVIGWLAAIMLLMIVYRFVNPPLSALMLQQWVSGEKIVNTWIPIEKISPNVIRAVIASEDDRFCEHNGVDFGALMDVVSDTRNGAARGASTISMQVVKNLFLWPSRSYIRKALEMPLTFVMEALWPKRRIMEVYLNIAEWGPGIFGIEAAARHHFRTSASSLSPAEASRLAVALPNPRVRNPAKPGPGMKRLARVVQMRTRLAPASRTRCVLQAGRAASCQEVATDANLGPFQPRSSWGTGVARGFCV